MKRVLIITAGIVPHLLRCQPQNSFNFASFEVYLFSPPAKNNVNKRKKRGGWGGGLVKHTVLFPSAKLRIHWSEGNLSDIERDAGKRESANFEAMTFH